MDQGRGTIISAVGLLFFILLIFKVTILEAAELKASPGSPPIEITAERLEAFEEKRLVVFVGNAVATQGDRVIKAQSLYLYYKKEGPKTTKEKRGSGGIERIEARGDVSISQNGQIITGDQAIYEHASQKIVVLGNAQIRQGLNMVQGDKIEFYLEENRGVVEAPERKRVKAIIFPESEKGGGTNIIKGKDQ